MAKPIPTHPLIVLAQAKAAPLGVFMLDGPFANLTATFGRPYRSDYYGVGICLRGRAELSADLEDCVITPQTVLAMPPQTIKQWRSMSADFEHVAIFFTQAYITHRCAIDPEAVGIFSGGVPTLALDNDESTVIADAFDQLLHRYKTAGVYRDEILKALITALLYALEEMQAERPALSLAPKNRGRFLTREFKRLVARNFSTERHVTFYARAMSVTPRHLSATVKEHTGKTASEWIQAAVVLEARVLMRDRSLTVAQVADVLNFADASTFGKFFKNLTGVSPAAYRKNDRLNIPTF